MGSAFTQSATASFTTYSQEPAPNANLATTSATAVATNTQMAVFVSIERS